MWNETFIFFILQLLSSKTQNISGDLKHIITHLH